MIIEIQLDLDTSLQPKTEHYPLKCVKISLVFILRSFLDKPAPEEASQRSELNFDTCALNKTSVKTGNLTQYSTIWPILSSESVI